MKISKFFPYSNDFPAIFSKKKKEIEQVFSDCEICHIGSTAIPGMGGKGIVDMLIIIDSWDKEEELIKKLKEIGYIHIHERENERRFVSKEPEDTGRGGVHIHIVARDSKEHKRLVSFKERLIGDPEFAEKYDKLKRELNGVSMKKYKEKKDMFIEKHFKKL